MKSRNVWTRLQCAVLAAGVLGASGTHAAPQLFVDAANGDDAGDGLTWATAKQSIQAAIDIAELGAAITVTNGTYAAITATNCFLTIQSVNGPEATTIQGGLGTRCATLMTWDQFEAFDLDDPSTWADSVTLNGFTLRGGQPRGANFFLMNGGGALGGALSNCVLTANNPERSGGGAARSILTGCRIIGNDAPANGGGAVHSLLRNCLITGNTAFAGGGAQGSMLENCTIYGNEASSGAGGGGVAYCNLRNSIVWDNTPDNHADLFSNMILEYTCITPLPDWAIGCTADAPLFANAAGGIFRLLPGSPCAGTGAPAFREDDQPMADGYGKSIYTGGRANMGAFSTAQAFHVDAARDDDSGDGLTWATAKQTVQAAIDLSIDGDIITVADGTYAPIATADKAITIQSANGPLTTFINGGGTDRCATLAEGSDARDTILHGFTLTNGFTTASGGGAYGGTLKGCILSGNAADERGGGAASSTLENCLLAGNSANMGGGAEECLLNNCTVSGNNAADVGGGINNTTAKNCIVWGNTAAVDEHDIAASTVSYTCASDGNTQNGNIVDDPLFADAANGDYRLRAGSPCVDTGDAALAVGATDLAGKPRILGAGPDMGAFEGGHVGVTFDVPQGSSPGTVLLVAGEPYGELPEFTSGVTGYHFTGWHTDPVAGEKVETTALVPSSDATLHARLAPDTYTVMLDPNNGTVVSNQVAVTYDALWPALPAPERTGYTFGAWRLGTVSIDASMTVSITNAATLVAVWTANTYTVTLDPNGGAVAPGQATVTYDAPYGQLPAPRRTDFSFLGWNDAGGTPVTSGTIVSTNADHTLTAQWDGAMPPGPDVPDGPAFPVSGTYSAYLYAPINLDDGGQAWSVCGLLTLAISSTSGKVTASLTPPDNGARVAFTAKALDGIDADGNAFVNLGKGGWRLLLMARQDRVWGSAVNAAGDTYALDGTRQRFDDTSDLEAQAALATFRLADTKGRYTLLLGPSADYTAPAAPAAPGYLTFTVNTRGIVRISGILADGTSVVRSEPLQLYRAPGGGLTAALPLFAPLYARKGVASGLLWLEPQPDHITVATHDADGWLLRWEDRRATATTRGFGVTWLTASGFNYAPAPAFPADAAHTLGATPGAFAYYETNVGPFPLHWDALVNGIPAVPSANGATLRLPAASSPVKGGPGALYDYSAPNSARATLSLSLGTGTFRSNFRGYAETLDARGNPRLRTVTATARGVLLTPPGVSLLGVGVATTPDTDPAIKPLRQKHDFPVYLVPAP